MLTTTQVGTAGEIHAESWLKANGWTCLRDTRLPGATDIEASSGTRKILVQIKTAIHPDQPAFLSGEEKKAIVARANRTGREAWLGRLQINQKAQLVAGPVWTKLS